MYIIFNQDIINYIQEFTNIKKLLDTTHQLDDIKYNIYLWKLNDDYSEKYILNNNFREILNKKVINKKQIYSFTLNNFYKKNLINLKFFSFITELNISFSSITNLDILDEYNLHKLILYECKKLKNIDTIKKFKNLYELQLSCKNSNYNIVYDMSILSELTNLHILMVSFVNTVNICQIEKLHNLHSLTLDFIYGNFLSNIKLNKLYILKLYKCSIDYNSLMNNILNNFTNLHILHLIYCDAGKTISINNNLVEFVLKSEIRYINILENKNMKFLILDDCTHLLRIEICSDLINLIKLSLHNCKSLKYIVIRNSLPKLYELNLSHCINLKNINELNTLINLQRLNLSYCTNLKNIDALSTLINLQYLDLLYCTNLENIDALSTLINLQILDLSYCTNLKNIDTLSNLINLQILYLSYCTNLKNIDTLNNLNDLNMLDLSYCTNLENISILSNLKNLNMLKIINCKHLYNQYKHLSNIEYIISV